MTEIKDGQSFSRIIRVYGIEQPVMVRITATGISFRIKGSKKAINASWTQAVNACNTPGNVQSFLMNRPFEFLKNTADKITASKVSKADKEIK